MWATCIDSVEPIRQGGTFVHFSAQEHGCQCTEASWFAPGCDGKIEDVLHTSTLEIIRHWGQRENTFTSYPSSFNFSTSRLIPTPTFLMCGYSRSDFSRGGSGFRQRYNCRIRNSTDTRELDNCSRAVQFCLPCRMLSVLCTSISWPW